MTPEELTDIIQNYNGRHRVIDVYDEDLDREWSLCVYKTNLVNSDGNIHTAALILTFIDDETELVACYDHPVGAERPVFRMVADDPLEPAFHISSLLEPLTVVYPRDEKAIGKEVTPLMLASHACFVCDFLLEELDHYTETRACPCGLVYSDGFLAKVNPNKGGRIIITGVNREASSVEVTFVEGDNND